MKTFPVLLALATLVSVASLKAAPPLTQHSSNTPGKLSEADWTGIKNAHGRQLHAIIASPDGTCHARNPGQGWMTRFDGHGFIVTPDAGGWEWGLELIAYGGQALSAIATDLAEQDARPALPQIQHDGGRLSFRRDSTLTEWFVNDARGLEQGWTLAKRPRFQDVTELLRLDLAVRGSLRPEVSQDGTTVAFLNTSGGTVLSYTGLRAWDADGEALSARFTQDESAENPLSVTVDDAGARYPITIDPLASQAYLKASNTDAGDCFGSAVAVSGNTVVVGAPAEASSATGVNGNQIDNSAPNSGAAYVFVRNGTTWSQQAYLKASNTGGGGYFSGDNFGGSVGISGDTVVVGAPNESSSATGVNGNQDNDAASQSGAVYVFVRNGTTWSQQSYLKASNSNAGDYFGRSVTVSGDTVLVGANGEASSATGVNGNQADNSDWRAGAGYVFVRSGTVWSQQAYLKASSSGYSSFGSSCALSGDTIVIGAPDESSNATGVNGTPSNYNVWDAGAAYVFARSGTTWSQQAYLKASNTGSEDQFGTSVAMSGDTVVVGAVGESSGATGVNGNQADNSADYAGAAYVFVRGGITWSQQAYLKASDAGFYDNFGASVAVSGDMVVIGTSYGKDRAYVFTRNGTLWNTQTYLKSSHQSYSSFGSSVAVSGGLVVVGAPYDDSGATGVNGNSADDSASNAGAACVFSNVSRPLNDDFASRLNLGSGTNASAAGTLAGATGEFLAQEPDLKDTLASPPELGGYNNDATVWYQWTAPSGSQWASVKVIGPQAATVISVYTGGDLAALTKVALNQHDLPEAPNRVVIPVTPGTTYQIRVAYWWQDYHSEPVLAFNLALSSFGNPTTAEQYIARGRMWLAQGSDTVLTQAASDFTAALAISPTNGEARFLRALTNLLLLENEPAFSQALTDLGASRTGSLRAGGELVLPEDPDGDPVFAPGAHSSNVIDWVNTQLLPRLATVRNDLSAITAVNFRTDLSAAETGSVDALVDKGDILVFKAVTHGLEMFFNLLFTYDLGVSCNAMATLNKSGQLDAQHVLATSSSLLKFAASDRRPQFAVALQAMEQDYAEASIFIRNNRSNPTHLVTEDLSNKPEIDTENRDTLATAAASLNGEVIYQETRVNLSRLVATTVSLRDWQPEYRGRDAVAGTFPDPTLDGVLPGMSRGGLDDRIYQMGRLWGMSQYAEEYGAFLKKMTGSDDPRADSDGDGRDNFSEWLARTDPLASDIVWQQFTRNVISPGINEVRITFARRKDLQDWKLQVAVSDDMATWDRTETQIEMVGLPVDNGDGFTETVTYRLKDAAALASRKFLQVEALPK